MPYIKKLHLHGFKSFAKPTELVFEKGMNAVVGPNGAGKSNITDAICFVLGKLKIKSMRAARAANLIYHGGKTGKPAQQAKVSMVFDNRDNVFVLPQAASEVEITRIVKKDGTSAYKINNEVKTRQEVLELLAQAGIDPEGFNIILQNEINSIIQLHPEEKRQIIEEIAGISIYEDRKEKSLHELEKTEEKLKEVKAVLNERNAYMRNLEKEKSEAEKYKQLKFAIRKDKAVMIFRQLQEKRNENEKLEKKINEKKESLSKTQDKANASQAKIVNIDKHIQSINEHIEQKSGVEQEKLFNEISILRSDAAVLNVKLENYKEQLHAAEKRAEHLGIDKIKLEQELKQLEQEKAREKARLMEVDAQTFKLEILKAALQIKEESKKLGNIFSNLLQGIRERKTRIDDLLRENKIKILHEEVNALVYSLEESTLELTKISKEINGAIAIIEKLKIGEEDKRNILLEMGLAKNELDHIIKIIRKSKEEKQDMLRLIGEMKVEYEKKRKAIDEKEKIEKKLRSSFEKLLLRKNQLQAETKKQELMTKEEQAKAREIENDINTLNILKARTDAELEVLDSQTREYDDLKAELEKISYSVVEIQNRISKNEQALNEIGSVNLRALEVYDKIKAEYDEIAVKVQKLEEEKREILKIVEEVDKKKKQAFMQVFNEVNASFSENFIVLSDKGHAFLELENKQDPFAGGMDILIKLAKGKYMDADSLSGGEKVIVALALIFAIQKYKPYCFYVFDEIDPALDKRNSEKLASILKKSIQNSQCIIITHNDAVTNQADTIYGATMQDGVSKIISLRV